MDRPERALPATDARSVHALAVTQHGGGVGFVERRPMPDPIAESAHRHGSIIGEPGSNVPVLPAAAIFQALRQIPMVETDPGFDAGFHYGVDQPVVEFNPLCADAASAFGENTRPCGRQAIGADAQFAHQRNILGPAMVMVTGDVAGRFIVDIARQVTKGVPDRRLAPVFFDRALDLISRGRGTPEKPLGKRIRHADLSWMSQVRRKAPAATAVPSGCAYADKTAKRGRWRPIATAAMPRRVAAARSRSGAIRDPAAR